MENFISEEERNKYEKRGFLIAKCKSCGNIFYIQKLGYKYDDLNSYECAKCRKMYIKNHKKIKFYSK